MTHAAVEAQLIDYNKKLEQWEAIIGRGALIHESRLLLVTMTSFSTQVKRAIALLKEGKTVEALQELGSAEA